MPILRSVGLRKGGAVPGSGGGGGGPGGVTTDLVAWYDADDAATITDTSGAVDQWNDKSGNGNHLTASAGDRPTTGIRTLNSKNVLDFDANVMTCDPLSTALTQPFTVFMVIDADATGFNYYLDGDATGNMIIGIRSNDQWRINAGVSLDGPVFGVTTGAYILEARFNSTSSELLVDDTQEASGDAGTEEPAGVTVGEGVGGAVPCDGGIAEIAIFNGALAAGDQSDVVTYLSGKWGITV